MSLLRALLARPDTRTAETIARDIAEEFRFHIDCATQRLVDEGVQPDEARRQARARFGNLDTWARRCAAIALEERRMLQRLNTALMVVVLLLVVGASVQMYLTQRGNAATLADISAELAAIKAVAPAEPPRPGQVFIDGEIERPGVYVLPTGTAMTLRRLITAAGGVDVKIRGTVEIKRDGTSLPPMDLQQLLAGRIEDPALEPDDLVFVNAGEYAVQIEAGLLLQSLMNREHAIPYTPNPRLDRDEVFQATARRIEEIGRNSPQMAEMLTAEFKRRFPARHDDEARPPPE